MEKRESKEELIKEAMKSWRMLGVLPEHEAWEKVQDKITSGKIIRINRATPIHRWMWAAGAAAACLLAFVFMYGSGSSGEEQKIAQAGTHELPEGSLILLNAKSTAQYHSGTFSEDRLIKLDGEAFFEVKEGSAFSVQTANGVVKVLGTSFNVKSFANIFEVKCYTGVVEVQAGGSSSVLNPGTSVRLNPDGLENGTFDPAEADWRNGNISFNNAALSEVFAEMERQFDVEIQYEGDPDRRFTGMFTDESVQEALAIVATSMNLSVENLSNNRYSVR